MSERVFQRDTIELDAVEIEHYTHDVFGPITVFKDVPIARAIVQEYDDGRAYKPGKELCDAAWTAEGRWAIAGRHPDTYVILNRDDIHGRTVNARSTKSLKDFTTKRPMDRGILADLEVFDDRVPPQLLKDMTSGKKTDVSICFSFDADKTPGVVEDEEDKSIVGTEYDYVQTNITIDHTAYGLEKGRCPMPLCGIGADEVLDKFIAGDPFGEWESMEDCIRDMMRPKSEGGQGYTREQAGGTCAEIEKKSKEKHKKDVGVKYEMVAFVSDLAEVLAERNNYATKDDLKGYVTIGEFYPQHNIMIRKVDALTRKDDLVEEEGETTGEVAEDYPSSEYSLATSCMCRECGYILMESPTVSIEKHCSEYKCPQCGVEPMHQRNSPESGEEIVQGDEVEWWQMLDWKEMKDAFDKLPEDIKSVIVDAGLCPECDEELEEDEADDEPEEEVVEPKKKKDTRTPDEVMRKFDRTLDDPDLKAKLKQY